MDSWFRSRCKYVRRKFALEQLEHHIVLDASLNPVQTNNPYTVGHSSARPAYGGPFGFL
jgi:hypothetical protein